MFSQRGATASGLEPSRITAFCLSPDHGGNVGAYPYAPGSSPERLQGILVIVVPSILARSVGIGGRAHDNSHILNAAGVAPINPPKGELGAVQGIAGNG